MKPRFQFINPIESSKSIYNRLLICQSYFPDLKIEGQSSADDVVSLKKALQDLSQKDFYIGDGGTSFRFLALRLSRYPGTHRIHLGEALQKRQQDDLLSILKQLKINFSFDHKVLEVTGGDWNLENEILVDKTISSQFLTSLLLNAWLLEKDLHIKCSGSDLSSSYITMTKKLLSQLGLLFTVDGESIIVKKMQKINVESINCEIDMSSAFVVAAIGAIAGGVRISSFPFPSLQGDSIFLQILQFMGIVYKKQKDVVDILPCNQVRPIQFNLKDAPDLFPVLAMLCAFSDGSSKLFGAPQLKNKESNRIESISNLLTKMKISHERLEDGLIIQGSSSVKLTEPTAIETYDDHRVAFAAAVAKMYGYPLIIQGADCVNKSFPSFWSYFPENFSTEVYS